MNLKELIKDNRNEEEILAQEEYGEKVIGSYFKYNKLKTLPVQKRKSKLY